MNTSIYSICDIIKKCKKSMRWWELHLFAFYGTLQLAKRSRFEMEKERWKKELKNDSNRTKLALLKYFKYMKHYLFIEIFDSENYLCYNFKDSMPMYSLYLTRLSSFLSISLFSCCFVCNGKIFSFYCIVWEKNINFFCCHVCAQIEWLAGTFESQ
jgi:hypothetical protein